MEIALPVLEKSAHFIIGKLQTAAASYLKEQYFWKTNLEEELKNLSRLLPQIQAVVDLAERKTITNNTPLEEWLWQFRDGIDEAEEVLDDLEYIELEKKANADKTKLSKAVDASIRIAKRVLKLDDVLERLRKCVQNLSSTAGDAGKFSRLVSSSSSEEYLHQQLHTVAGVRITTSLPGSTLFEGREKEKQIIIQALTEELESGACNVRVLPLVGMGGVGKTTLAQQVYKHFEDVKYFDVRIWVCVSTDFNVVSLTKKILESVTDVRSDYENLDKLQTKIREILPVKRFLLVLDDTWNDSERGDWERLCAPLQEGQKGSRILLTTRTSSVIKMVSTVMRGTMKQINLGGLSKDECRSLLYHYAFGNEDPDAHPDLTRVGEEIIVKLQGVPLLAKTIGGVLGSTLDLGHWRRVLENEVWEMPQNSKEDFIPALRLSYYMLSARLKRCFGYCSLFPQDYEFEKQKLVSMWVAAGLIQPQQSEGLEEDIAGECFDMLCAKSLFDTHPSSTGYYIMHDMLHGLACHVSRHECCRIMHDQPKIIPYTIRHLSITCNLDELPRRTEMVHKLRHLRTLFIDYLGHTQKLYDFIQRACTSPRSIRVLVINGSISFDKRWLDSFINLRFLLLSSFYDSKLPESLCRFYFLQFVDITCDGSIPDYLELPSGMNKLINLKYFHGSISTLFKVGKLTCLQELRGYEVGTKDGYRIDELKDMNDLRHLGIYNLHNVQRVEEANRANLQMKKKLRSLTLSWPSDETNNSVPEHDYQVLAALNPPPHIRELKIEDYRGGKSAPWMSTPSLSYLQSLEIFSCPGWEELPPLWEFALLKHLYLYNMDAVRRFGPESSNSNGAHKPLFPSLETLSVKNLPRLQEWDDADVYIWFPHLRELSISRCLELRKIPCLPFSLKKFRLNEVGLTSLPRSYMTCNDPRTLGRFRELMSLQVLEIYACPEILYRESTSEEEEDGNLLPSSLTELEIVDVQGDSSCRYLGGLTMLSRLSLKSCRGMAALPSADHLTALQRLTLYQCNDLVSLRGLHSITSLWQLEISDCPKLREDTDDLPASLTLLQLSRCNFCHEWLSQCLQGLTSLSTLQIRDCPKILSLPKAELLYHLTELEMHTCDELQDVESLRALASLQRLRIFSCPKLLAAASSPQQPSADKQRETQKERGTSHSLQQIEIDSILYLLILPAPKGIVSIYVYNYNLSEFTPKFNLIPKVVEDWLLQCHDSLQYLILGSMPCLQSLPASLESFSKLKSLSLWSAPRLESLPRMPASLEKLYIADCNPRLNKRCRENTGDDWPKIKHIPDVIIETGRSDEIQVPHGSWSFTRLYKMMCSTNTDTT